MNHNSEVILSLWVKQEKINLIDQKNSEKADFYIPKKRTKLEFNTLACYRVAQIIAEDKRAFTDGKFAKNA